MEPLDELLELKNKYDNAYYNTGTPLVSDEEYDKLVERINKIGLGKTTGVGYEVVNITKKKLPYYLGSLDKIKTEKKLDKWKLENKAQNYIVSHKLDGVSCLCVCEDGKISLYTRGDGTIGGDISTFQNIL